MKRLAIVSTVITGLLLILGLADWLTNYNWSNDQDPLFGNPHILLNDGATVLVAAGLPGRRDRAAVGAGAAEGPGVINGTAELRALDVSFAYHGAVRAALRHVDFSVAPGEVVLVTGASGCGKSTLALALCGLIPSRVHGELRGRVMFGDRPLSGLPPHEASQLVGMVFQNPNLQLINQTVQSEVAFGPENLALPQPEIAARVDWCLDVTGLAGLRHAATVTLSGGQKQRTAIAATLAMRPRVLVLDEPLSDLDPVGAQEVLGTLRRLAAESGGTGIVIIEHRVDEVAPWADRVVLMDDGRVRLSRPPRGAWDDEAPWLATGVGIPDLVRLAHAVPDAFPGGAPLSVDEAVEAARGTWLASGARSGRPRRGPPAVG